MNSDLLTLTGTAALLGVIHTLLGPDHYVPFIAMARAGTWSKSRTVLVTVLSGVGHVGSSVLIGALGIGLGIGIASLEWIESVRGDFAAWLLTAFGLVYCIWGIRRALRGRKHAHIHAHADGHRHIHDHTHREEEHLHVHAPEGGTSLTPWVLFTIFVFGPCEPLIPVLLYPAAVHSTAGVALVASVFGITTIGTMVSMVVLGLAGVELIPAGRFERYTHALAGGIIALSGCSILFLGL